jgi:hypothetical protein
MGRIYQGANVWETKHSIGNDYQGRGRFGISYIMVWTGIGIGWGVWVYFKIVALKFGIPNIRLYLCISSLRYGIAYISYLFRS